MFLLDPSDPLIKKLQSMVIGKHDRYPKDSPFLNHGEEIKFKAKLAEFQTFKVDAFVTNEILANLAQDKLTEAIAIVQFNYQRVGFGS